MQTRYAKRQKIKEADLAAMNGVDRINNLPDDCLIQIFSLLSSPEDRITLTKVCKRWKNLGSGLWFKIKTLNLIGDEEWKSDYSKIIPSCGGYLRDIAFSVSNTRSDIIEVVTENCKNLNTLRVRFEFSSGRMHLCEELAELFRNNPNLRSIAIENVRGDFSQFIDCLLTLPENLLELELWGYRRLRSCTEKPCAPLTPFIPIISQFTKLRRLLLNGFIIKRTELKFVENLSDLRALELYYSWQHRMRPGETGDDLPELHNLDYVFLHRAKISNNWMTRFVTNNLNIKHLKLHSCRMSQVAAEELSKLVNLETLEVWQGWGRRASPMIQIPTNTFVNLKKFVCNVTNEASLVMLLRIAPDLEVITVPRGTRVTARLLDSADDVAMSRKKDVPLRVMLSREVIKQWNEPDEISPLIVEEIDPAVWHESNRKVYSTIRL